MSEEFPWIGNLKIPIDIQEDPVEDIIYILMSLVEQARDQFLEQPSVSKQRLKLRRQLDIAILKLLDSVRREHYGSDSELTDDTSLVKVILRWMYKG